MRFLALLATAGLSLSGAAEAEETAVVLAGMNVAVWSEETPTLAKEPVIIFSHGFHGCATQSRFLMEAFASHGYLVFAPNHRDATCDSGTAKLIAGPEVAFRTSRIVGRYDLPRSRRGYSSADQCDFERQSVCGPRRPLAPRTLGPLAWRIHRFGIGRRVAELEARRCESGPRAVSE